MSAHVILNLLIISCGKRFDVRLCQASYRLSATSLINSITHELECKIFLKNHVYSFI